MDQAWRNILAILDDAGMDAGNLVKITAYLTRCDDLKAFREMRDSHLTDVKPASTLLIVSGLADPGWRVEIEALAAKRSEEHTSELQSLMRISDAVYCVKKNHTRNAETA